MASKVKKPDADKPLYSTVIVVDLGSAKFLADFRSLVHSMSEASNGFPEELRRALLENLSRIRKIVSKQQKGSHLVCALLAMKGRFFNPYAFDPFKSDSVETLEAIAHALALLTIIENATVSFQQYYSTKFILVANDAHKLIESLQSRCLPISFNPYSVNLDDAKSTLLRTIESRFDEIDAPFCRESVQRIVDCSYPDFRMIANRIEFELL